MNGESRSGVSEAANSPALIVRWALDLAALAQQARQPAERLRALARSFCPPQPPAAATASSASSVASSAGASRSSSGAG